MTAHIARRSAIGMLIATGAAGGNSSASANERRWSRTQTAFPQKSVSERSRSSREQGMTLLELMVVILLLSIIARLFPIAIQRLGPAWRLAAAARSLAIDIRALQSQAAVSGHPLELTLEVSGYTVQQAATVNARHVAWPPNTTATLRVHPDDQPSRTIVMYPDGSSSGGEFELRSDRSRRTVSVTVATGQVRVR